MAQSLHVLCAVGRGSASNMIEPKSSGCMTCTFEKLRDIRKYAHPDFLAEVQCNLGGRTIERVRYYRCKHTVAQKFDTVLHLG